ncbi:MULTISPECIES: peptidylprolyl isomerase [Flavobacterium]|jgi:peptidyl-prolyl cis-trans isomerase D|uniref:Periplasmic chaperone PpiD n=1 Tax=Flavobacterium lindanitolerans TaxID=428988 RepID=A0A497VH26_9FLAO|nr:MULTISPECIES: peptidylprolyl isomerase [Flavobacterium]KQS46563.1 peptidylprolyl isomerase [Flavobacterium sp. Leaf359]PKW28522.1 peptidyl-prolyl cis-trans isomerase D [Flavobacterium lindanitolerans]RLJ35973.1 peptidyl-prolyl cis-trans isomerase D [Flavobacterium lindanitolerans]
MAVLSKIRQRSLLLIFVIGFCLLAFVVGDLINSGGFKQTSKYVGSINGEDISFEDFRSKVDAVEKGGQGISSSQAANQVWEQEVSLALLTEQFEKLGIRVGESQILDVLKQSQDIGQNPQFQNAAGQFDYQKYKEFFQSNPELTTQLRERETQAAINAKYQIYSTMLKAGLITTEAEGKLQYEMESDKVTFDYVAFPFSNIKDSEVPVSNDEIVAYMRKNEKKFKADETRELQFVVIDDKPSKEDEEEVKKNITALLSPRVVFNETTGKNDTIKGFKDITNNQEFVDANSDVKYDSTYVTKNNLPAQFADQLYNLPTGEVFGPYIYNGYYAISKSLGKKAGASAKASHILVSYAGSKIPNPAITRTKEEAKAKADDLFKQIQANPAILESLVATNSDDQGSLQTRGEYDNIVPGQMVKPFNDFVFNSPIGKVGLVETEFGFHIVKVIDKRDAVRLATIAQRIEPSEATSDDIFKKATKIEMEAKDKDFATVVKSLGLTVASANVKALDENFGSFTNQRQVVRWAYNKETSEGDVKRFNVPNGNLIVKLKKINEEGLMAISDAKPIVEPILKNQKKTEKIKQIMKGATLEEAAKAAKVSVANATDLTLQNPNLLGFGAEPKVVGTAFATAPNKVSDLIEGRAGVFKLQTKSVVKAPAIKNYDTYTARLKAMSGASLGRIIPALKDKAKIKDNRLDFGF